MSFISGEFLALFAIVFAIYWWLPHRVQNGFLVVASLVFYGWVTPWYVWLLLYSTVLDFGCGLAIERWRPHARHFVGLSVLGNMGLLGTFKYFDFFVGNVATALAALGLPHDLPMLNLILPIGVSFYTFSTLSYSIDVYRKRLPAVTRPLEFLLFVSFFPQLIAGPIMRASVMLPQIRTPRSIDLERARTAVGLVVWGAFKKVVIADLLTQFAGPVFASDRPSAAMIWSASLAASIALFADFSGYTDIARGTARLLGFELAKNFDRPFLALTPNEWWGRWHITFYEWIRDYVFQPLVLNAWCRRWLVPPFIKPNNHVHMVRGIVISMVLSGVWHGAGWNYVVWGSYFAALQLVYYAAGRLFPPQVKQWPRRAWVQRPLMILWMLVSTLLFYEPDLGRVVDYLSAPLLVGTPAQWLAATVLVLVSFACIAPLVGHDWWTTHQAPRWKGHPVRLPLETAAWCVAAWLVYVFVPGSGADFAYFRF